MSGSQRGQDEPATIEVLIVLATPPAPRPARQVLEDAGGRVIAMYGAQVWIAELGTSEAKRLDHDRRIRSVFEGPVPDEIAVGLDESGRLGVAAWNMRHTDEHKRAKAARPGEGLAWDHEGFEPEG
jgi:hypothetical protein